MLLSEFGGACWSRMRWTYDGEISTYGEYFSAFTNQMQFWVQPLFIYVVNYAIMQL